jgi:hypothetical protein
MSLVFDLNSRISSMARLTANVSGYVIWSIDNHELTRVGFVRLRVDCDYSTGYWASSFSRCDPVRDKPQAVSTGEGSDQKNCHVVRHDRFEKLHGVSSDICQESRAVESYEGSAPW